MTDYLKLSQLNAASNVATTDLMEIAQDQGDGTYISKKVTFSNVAGSITAPMVLYGTGNPPEGDYPDGTIYIKTYS